VPNILEYTLSLSENLSTKLKTIGINNEKQLAVWSKVQTQVNAASATMNSMGRSIGSLNERVNALRAQKEWIPANNRAAIRATNHEIKALEKQIEKLNNLNGGRLSKWWGDLKQTAPFQMITNPIVLATVAGNKFVQYLKDSQLAYQQESVEANKLQTLMRNSMGARDGEIKSVLELTSAQQKLGVIGDETQLSGAQELSTYLTKSEHLKKLIPSMNDMLAQQYGLNATQEQAVTIAQMMGKVLDGQTGALSRYGYRFDESQEKVLKFGTEEQKVAMLSQILQKYVGGVNQELAKTPEGKLKQHANNAGDLQEKVGKLVVQVKAAMLPIQDFFLRIFEKVVVFFENLGAIINKYKDPISVIVGIIGTLTLAIIFYNAWQKTAIMWQAITATWTKIVTFFKMGEAAAWWAATIPMLITIGIIALIIAAVVSIIAVIVYCVKHVTGWGETWKNITTYMGLAMELFKTKLTLIWLDIKNDFLSGFEVIAEGWYNLQSLWDKEGAQNGLAKIEAQRNDRLQEIASAKGKVDELKKQMSDMTVFALKTDGTSFGEFLKKSRDKIMPSLGANDALQASVIPKVTPSINDDGSGKSTQDAIATGGTRNTSINITVKSMIENIQFSGSTKESMAEIERNLAEGLYRVLAMAEVSAT
jgi:hypothetical protein